MEGGVAILLLLIIVVVGGGIAIALYVTGGAIGSGSSKKTEGGDHRPEHKTVSSPTQEKVRLAGTRQDHEGDS
jgi:hypothetical protein